MNTIKSNITAFILSGGKSSRMGSNKSFLEIEGKPLIKRMLELLDPIFSQVVISSSEPSEYVNFGKQIISDVYPLRGPLSGIHSALSHSKTDKNFIISCDMPFISKELINYLVEYKTDSKILLPLAEGRIQQLCGIYSKYVHSEVENLLIQSSTPAGKVKGSVYELLDEVETEIADVSGLNFYHPHLFFNINTQKDYNYAKKILKEERS